MVKTVAIIPARGGSKGVPKKNIIDVKGKPLIYYTLKRALDSNYIDEIVVSSDDDEILKIVSELFPSVILIKRPDYLSGDESKSSDVILHALGFLEKNYNFDLKYIVMLESTSPLRDINLIDNAIIALEQNIDCTALVGISKVEAQHPSFLCTRNSKSQISPLNGSNVNLRRQDLNLDYYYYEGSIYISEKDSFFSNKNFYHSRTMGFIVDKIGSIEVDDFEDLLIVRNLISLYF
jgi:CMP-N,N'-diacetyllegionaminic acid synthase